MTRRSAAPKADYQPRIYVDQRNTLRAESGAGLVDFARELTISDVRAGIFICVSLTRPTGKRGAAAVRDVMEQYWRARPDSKLFPRPRDADGE